MTSDGAEILYSVLLGDSLILVAVIVFFWAGVFVARRFGYRAGYGLGSLGFARPRPGYLAATVLGIATGVGALFLSLLALPLSAYLVEWLGYSAEPATQGAFMQDVQDWIGENPGVAIPLTVFAIVLFAPAVEEIIFRGAVFGGLRKLVALLLERYQGRSKGKAGETVPFILAALASSAMFSLLHLDPVLLPMLLVLAVVLCALYRKTGSLLAPFLAHVTFNSFATLALILSGLGLIPPM